MSSGELTEWAAFERVYGSLLPHERIDAGFAQVCYVIASVFVGLAAALIPAIRAARLDVLKAIAYE